MGIILIMVCFLLSGFLLSRSLIFLVFKRNISNHPGGLAGSILRANSKDAGNLIADSILNDSQLRNSFSGSTFSEKIRPDISNHIDHFLEVKLKAVFPLLSQFMGEKTRSQLKTAFMDEMDRLLPEVMDKLNSGILNKGKIAELASQKIVSINFTQEPVLGWINKMIQPRLDLFCCSFMLLAGLVTVLLNYLLTLW